MPVTQVESWILCLSERILWSAKAPPPAHMFYLILLWAFFFTQVIHDFILIVNISGIFQKEYESPSLPLFLSISPAGCPLLIVYIPIHFLYIFWQLCVYMCMPLLPYPHWTNRIVLSLLFCSLIFFFTYYIIEIFSMTVPVISPDSVEWVCSIPYRGFTIIDLSYLTRHLKAMRIAWKSKLSMATGGNNR